ncbi:acyltransferase family protein [Actinoplanes sp. NPDC051343]|uniref:acyltransferase family protein n=1 Tax=Actinoplanes sp. NPDC051343 TaxID=3363906 RepID=UPI00378EBB1F
MRNRYLDLLRAAAIVRVIVYHLFGWPWLSLLLPAMGVMFALAGSLAAASLEKRPARKVVFSRLRRLLPPLWLLGLIAVPAMLAAGWASEHNGEHPFDTGHLWHLAFWIFPLGDPPGSDRAADLWDPLWYIRAYVWFLLLSPLMWLVYRKIGWLAVAAPIVAIAVLDKTGFSLPDTADAAMWDFVTYGACWIAGFAHHDGRIRRIGPRTLVFLVLVLGLVALYWQNGHQGEEHWDLNDVPESQALWSIAFVLLALRWEPSMTWLPRVRPLDRLVTLLNARAVTIYLWHNLAITAVWPVLGLIALGGVTFDDIGHGLDGPVDLTAAMVLTLLAVLAFGWVEDLAARRRPRLWPTAAPTLRRAEVPPEEAVPALVGAYPIGGGMAARPEGPDFADRSAGHTSAAAAMHREQFRRSAPRSVPWAADVPAIEGVPGDGTGPLRLSEPGTTTPIRPPGGTGPLPLPAGPDAIQPVGGSSDPDSATRPFGDNEPSGAMRPRSATDPGGAIHPLDATGPEGATRPFVEGPAFGGATHQPGNTTEPGGGTDQFGGSRGAGRHAAPGDARDLDAPPSDWPPARLGGGRGGGVPDWFRQQRNGFSDSNPE